ncbi:MAG: GyrI-like domain-containing protein [bacterium]|nr:GyrI-like domain-containing protein [bacterium]
MTVHKKNMTVNTAIIYNLRLVCASLASSALALMIAACGGPDLSKYDHLKTPQISQKASMQMLVTEITGDPNETTGAAFGVLYGAYYSIDGASVEEPWPRSRWSRSILTESTPMSEWRGVFAVPVADSLTEIPPEYAKADPAIRLETWDYGTVAEILHIGSYEDMTATTEKIEAHIEAQGYRITGMHEEEYLKGPGMIFEGDPNEYITILRYEVAK